MRRDKRNWKAGDIINGCTLIERVKGSKSGRWTIKCACGNTFEAPPSTIAYGSRRSCGCVKKKQYKNQSESPLGTFYNGTYIDYIRSILDEKTKPRSASGITGVYMRRRRSGSIFYTAEIKICGERKYLGVFDTLEQARQARKEAEYVYFGSLLNEYDATKKEDV